jgi:uncharacterized protein YjcR
MPNALKVDREAVKADYQSGMKQKEIVQKYGISLNTLKSWVQRYHWAKEERCEKWYRKYLLSMFSYKQLYQIVMAYAEEHRNDTK